MGVPPVLGGPGGPGVSPGSGGAGSSLDSVGGIGGLLAVQDTLGTSSASDDLKYIYTYDGNGNVAQLIDLAAGSAPASIVAHYEYDAYGNALLDVSNPLISGPYAATNPFRFSTKFHDHETGLQASIFRYYDAKHGRWLNRDPIGETAGPNVYSYLAGRPNGAVDPFGLDDLRWMCPQRGTPVLQARCCDTSSWRTVGSLDRSNPSYVLVVATDGVRRQIPLDQAQKYAAGRTCFPLWEGDGTMRASCGANRGGYCDSSRDWQNWAANCSLPAGPGPANTPCFKAAAIGDIRKKCDAYCETDPGNAAAYKAQCAAQESHAIDACDQATDTANDLLWFYACAPLDLAAGVRNTAEAAQIGQSLRAIGQVEKAGAECAGNIRTTRFGPHVAGPLPAEVASCFRGGSYARVQLAEDTYLYRMHGGDVDELGRWWTRCRPQGGLQGRMDLAIDPEWGNTCESLAIIRVPKGTVVFEGAAERQGCLLGGGNQVFIPNVNPRWLVESCPAP